MPVKQTLLLLLWRGCDVFFGVLTQLVDSGQIRASTATFYALWSFIVCINECDTVLGLMI
jgi:hypothetical protein